ncbi:TAXI family TRAP transporter solute-binding subunit [Halomonas sp. HK25]|uniref:TAXI family TRAP transporter solute-binding subunit n=1 Tax=Halomonas sp. HK25 TaxID=3394321 RepID=UPI0039FD60DF
MTSRHLFATGLLAAGLSLGTLAQAASISVEAAGPGSQSGTLVQALAQYTESEGISLEVILGQGLTRSAMKVAAGQADSTFVVPPVVKMMREASGPFEAHGDRARDLSENLRSLFGLPGGIFHAVTWADAGVERWHDVAGKRVYVGPPGGAAAQMIIGMIELETGLVADEDYDTVRIPWGAATQAFQDGQFDVLVLSSPVGQQSLNELSLQREIRLLGIAEELIESDEWRAYTEETATTHGTIPAGTYSGQINSDEDVLTSANIIYMAVNATMPDEVAYGYTRAYWENLDEMKAGNAMLRALNTDDPFIGLNAPLHPGAVKYYRDAGLEIPEHLLE